ncbi:MAG: hypothetical protein WCQ21_29755 [Verrucomicrobiota bacterium]
MQLANLAGKFVARCSQFLGMGCPLVSQPFQNLFGLLRSFDQIGLQCLLFLKNTASLRFGSLFGVGKFQCQPI